MCEPQGCHCDTVEEKISLAGDQVTCPLTQCHIPEDLTLQQHTGLVVYLVATAHNGNTCRNAEVLRQQYSCSLHKLCRVLLHFCPSLIQYDFIVADFFMLQSLLGCYCDNE